MSGTTSIQTTTYTTPKKVVEFVNYFSEIKKTLDGSGNIIGNEAVATADGTKTRFALDNNNVVAGTDNVYLGTAISTAYTIDEDNGLINFTVAPTNAVAITAAYKHTDIPSSVISDYIKRVEDIIERRIGRSFKTSTTVTETYDSETRGITNAFAFQPSRFIDDAETYQPMQHDKRRDKFLQVYNYPIIAINLIGLNEKSDKHNDEVNQDADSSFGSTAWVAQSFQAGQTLRCDRVAALIKYNAGTAADITVGLYSDSSGSPGTQLTSGTITAPSNTTYQMYDVFFTNPPQLTSGTTYHIVLSSPSSSTTSVYKLGVDSTSPSETTGSLLTSANSGSSWTADTTKDAIYNVYVVDSVANYNDYRISKNDGRIVLTGDSGKIFARGIQNIVVNYSYGYADVPDIVEDIATKLAAIMVLESKLLGSPVQLEVVENNVRQLKRETDDSIDSLGRKLELRVI